MCAECMPANIYVGLLGAVQSKRIKYMGAPSMPADIYVPTRSSPANRDKIYGCSKHASRHICATTMSGSADKWIICASPAIQSSKSIDCYCIFYSFFQYSCTLFEMSSNQLMNHWFPA